MEKKGVVSVIVPVYNVQDYIGNCILSIIGQSYKDLEIILVDDGSTDNSKSICDEYARNDNRIKVIHKANGGLSDARNKGIDSAMGEYITFVDGDDTINVFHVEIMVDCIKNGKCDIAQNVIEPTDSQNFVRNEIKPTVCVKTITANEYLKKIATYVGSCSFCDKLFKRSLFAKYRFEGGLLNEDLLLIATMFIENRYSLCETDYYGYNYYKRGNSSSRSGFAKSITDTLYNCERLIKLSKEKLPEMEIYFKRLMLYQIRTFLILMPKEYIKEKNKDYIFAFTHLKANGKYIKGAFFGKKDKIFLRLFQRFPRSVKRLADKIVK